MGYPCRCWVCWTRRTLPKHPEDYKYKPKCKNCKRTAMFLCTERRSKKDRRNKRCDCGGYWFEHRKGSKWCHENPNIEELMKEYERHG